MAAVSGALGVVFGDIGTSPIYTLQTLFNPASPHRVTVTQTHVYGVISLIFWSEILIVTVTYVLLAMRVDNGGEGGIMALISLLRRWPTKTKTRTRVVLAGLGVIGAALFLGDSMITPAISVLSAVEGVKAIRPSLQAWVIPLTVAITVGLFSLQRLGTELVARLFGPVMMAWFAVIAVIGARGITQNSAIVGALSPMYAINFALQDFHVAFFSLSAVVLAVTGAEALYADMGHFGRRPISAGWVAVVLPACTLSYLGQGALLLRHPSYTSAPFFLLTPSWARLPVVILACLATVIASQAVISGAFSVAAQASQLGYLPAFRVLHTSRSSHGQIYVPLVNWLLMVSVLVLIVIFRASEALAFAYGTAVAGTILVTTILVGFVAKHRWRLPRSILFPGIGALISVDLVLLASNLTKLAHGAWLPLAVGVAIYTIMTTWRQGRQLVASQRRQLEGPLIDFVSTLRDRPDIKTVDGTAIFLSRTPNTAPLALRANIEHNQVRHRQIVVVTVEIQPVPVVTLPERLAVDQLGDASDGITHITIRFGYAESPDVPGALRNVTPLQAEGSLDLNHATYFLSKIDLRVAAGRGPRIWQKRLFLATSHLATDPSDHFGMPKNRIVTLGAQLYI
jgi:KUP system potassium uptake protein